MITKKTLLSYIYDVWGEMDALESRIDKLEREARKPRPSKRGTNVDGVKKKAARPRKSK